MAWETRRTAKTATKTLELEQMPVLGVRDFKFDFAPAGQRFIASIRPAIEFFNAGRVAVAYKVKSCDPSFAHHGMSGPLAQRGRVLPGASITFFHPGLSHNPPASNFPATGRIRLEYEYSDESGRQLRSIVETIEYTVAAVPATGLPRVTWAYIELGSSRNARLRSPSPQRSSRRRSDFRCAAIRSPVVPNASILLILQKQKR
jgi:hypothetical protein